MPFYESVRPYKRMPNNGKFIADLLITGRKFSQEKFMRIIIMVTYDAFAKKQIQPKREVTIDVLKDLQLIITKLG